MLISYYPINSIIFNNILKVSSQLGIRQADDYFTYGGASDDVSGLGFILWLIIILIFINGLKEDYIFNKDVVNYKQNMAVIHFSLLSIIFFLFSYFFIPPLARTIQNSALIILTLNIYLTRKLLILFNSLLVILFFYTLINYFNEGILYGFIR